MTVLALKLVALAALLAGSVLVLLKALGPEDEGRMSDGWRRDRRLREGEDEDDAL